MNEGFTVVLPVLNEIDNLVILLPELKKFGCEIIVCDNGSTDSGPEYVKCYHKDVILSKGWGTVVDAIQRGFTLASHNKVLVMDSDLSHPVATVPLLIQALDTHDMVLGSRYIKGGNSGDSLKNKVISRGFNLLAYFLAPSIKDRSSGLWAVRKTTIKGVRIRNTTKPALEYIVRGKIDSVGEVPYEFQGRGSGKSKIGKPILREFYGLALLYLSRYNRLAKFLITGGIGTCIYISFLTIFTEVVGWWYVSSALTGILFATTWNYTINSLWTFGSGSCDDPDYEWKAWYKGNLLQKWWKRNTGKVVKAFCGSPKVTLDLGCGSSPLINELPGRIIGMDRDMEKLCFLGTRTNADLVRSDLSNGISEETLCSDVPRYPRSIDNIVCTNVLEHLEYPSLLIKDAGRLLCPDGTFIVTIPDYDNPFTRVVETLYGKLFPNGHQQNHCSRLSSSSLKDLCKSYGLQYVDSKGSLTDTVLKFKKVA